MESEEEQEGSCRPPLKLHSCALSGRFTFEKQSPLVGRPVDCAKGRSGVASQLAATACLTCLLAFLPPFPDDRQEAALNLSTNGISSINMSIEINGVVYTGKTEGPFAPPPPPPIVIAGREIQYVTAVVPAANFPLQSDALTIKSIAVK